MKNYISNVYGTLTDEYNRFGVISVLLIVVAIFGGIAVGSFTHSPLMMSLMTAGTMLTEAFILAVQPMKRIVNVSLVALLINIIFVFAGFLS